MYRKVSYGEGGALQLKLLRRVFKIRCDRRALSVCFMVFLQGKRADSSRRTRSGSGSKGRRRSRPPTRRSSSKSSEDEPRKRRDKFPEERSRSRSRRRRGSLRSSVDEREFRDREKEERRRKRSRPSHERLDKEVERLTRKIVKDEIRSRDGQTWNRTGNLKQFEFNSDVLTVQEDLGVALEKFFQGVGMEIPSSVNGILAQGKQKLNERNLDLRRADDAGWDAVEQFHRDPLCSTEDQEKRWKKAKKEAQEKREKDKDKKTSVRGGGRGGASRDAGRGGFYGAKLFGPRQSYFPPAPFLMGRGGGGFYPRGGQGGWQDSWRRLDSIDIVGSVPSVISGQRCILQRGGVDAVSDSSMESAGGATSMDTRPTAATSIQRRSEVEEEVTRRLDVDRNAELVVKPVSGIAITNDLIAQGNKYKSAINAESRLDKLEKASSLAVGSDEDEVIMYEEETGVEMKVKDTLRVHLPFWRQSGASSFAVSVIEKGYIPTLDRIPREYEEPNNVSYKANRVWANEAVEKLRSAKLIRKVARQDLICTNPLTVASNAVGKLRLCIDLSRCVNEVTQAPKFRIESTIEALQVVQPGDWAFSFDLKSAYHQIPLHVDYHKFFGFAIEKQDGTKEYFCYVVMPFGLNDASRVLTKVMKSPLERWRKMGILVYIHLDDGFAPSSGKAECLAASEQVRRDLIKYGLLISEQKCSWGARQCITWTGFEWDLRNFKLRVPEEKLLRAEKMIKEMKEERGKIPVRQLAKVVGLLGSFGLAMGEVVRFQTRAMMMNIARVTEDGQWGRSTVLGSREREELAFWAENLRTINGFRMRKQDRVVEVVTREMYSDASDFFMAGAEFCGLEKKEGSSYQTCFNEEEREESSTFRELRAIEEGLKVRGAELQGCLVKWGCDNWAASVIVRIGSMKPRCHEVAARIVDLAKKWEIELDTFWLSRDEIPIVEVDRLSKEVDTSDYKLSRVDFRMLESEFGPFSCDMFASSFSYQMQPYVAKVASAQAAWVDAFTLDWKNTGFMFLHPPVGLVVRVLRYAAECRAGGLLVVPFWPGAIFMAKLRAAESAGKVILVKKFRPELISPVWVKSRTFHGPARFDFFVYQLNF